MTTLRLVLTMFPPGDHYHVPGQALWACLSQAVPRLVFESLRSSCHSGQTFDSSKFTIRFRAGFQVCFPSYTFDLPLSRQGAIARVFGFCPFTTPYFRIHRIALNPSFHPIFFPSA